MSSFSRGFLGCIAICLCLVGLPATTPVASEQQPPLAEWTVLVFMNGDNNLEEDALINFQQIAAIGSTALVNVLVQLDRNGNYAFTQPQWTQTLRFRVTKDMAPLPKNALQDLGEVNMGDPAALSDFVQWGKSAYPAKRYMLVIWDHGQGWRVFNTAFLQRHRELVAAGRDGTVETTSRDLSDRDRRDRTRSVDPLVPAGDARFIDTSALSPDQVVEQMIAALSTGL